MAYFKESTKRSPWIALGLVALIIIALASTYYFAILPGTQDSKPSLITMNPDEKIMAGLSDILKDLQTLTVEFIPMEGDSIGYSYRWDDDPPDTMVITNKNIIGRLLVVLPNYPDSGHITIQVVGPKGYMSGGGK